MSDNGIGCFAVAFRLCCSPAPLQLLQRVLARLRAGETEPGSEYQTSANR
jgi:hypothetical protein